MTLSGKVIQAPAGIKGFDCNEHLSINSATQFRMQGHRFCLRYVPRHDPNPGDLSTSEAATILSAGLALMVVQHVQLPGWVPSGRMGAADYAALAQSKGTEYGAFAAKSCQEIGIPPRVTVWCDLEGVKPHIDSQAVITFCNNWHIEVSKAGYTPGLYVGYDPGLTASQLYYKLRFQHYWSAYNLNPDQVPLVRGVQMKQGIERVLAGVRYDPDVIVADKLGGLPLMLADAEWSA